MSSDSKNMNKSESESKNDWDDDEGDNWEDWGDAVEELEKQPPNCNNNQDGNDKSTTTTTKSLAKDSNSNQKAATEQAPAKNSWGQLWGGLSSLTSTVSQGLNQVIGAPGPEEMARINAAEAEAANVSGGGGEKETSKATAKSEPEPSDDQSAAPVFGLGLVTTLGSKVLSSGLDTLEGIGKKTMHILQENDPLLKNKRKMLGLEPDRPNLSEILHAAKKDADQLETRLNELKIEKSKELLRFDALFENNCGLVHLEALEILSKESAMKLQTLLESVSGKAHTEMRETIDEVTELFDFSVSECDDSDGDYNGSGLNDKLLLTIEDADLPINFDEIVNTWTQAIDWIAQHSPTANAQSVFANGITALAQTCALEVNKLHKIAELLLVKEHHSTANEVDAIVQLCKQFYIHLVGLTNRFASTLSEQEQATDHISTFFAELVVAQQQIDQAYKLFLPILQIGAV